MYHYCKPKTSVYCYSIRSIKLSAFSIASGYRRNSWSGRTTNTINAMVNQHGYFRSIKGRRPTAKHCQVLMNMYHIRIRVELRSYSMNINWTERYLWPPLTGFDWWRGRKGDKDDEKGWIYRLLSAFSCQC